MSINREDVIFRKWLDGQIIALFPNIPWANALECSSYMHVGQHGGASPRHVIAGTKPAKPEEYAALARELTGLGYVLRVMKRQPRRRSQAPRRLGRRLLSYPSAAANPGGVLLSRPQSAAPIGRR